MEEKYSSAITLSDMEIFVFPELMYSLLLANIMSPVIWRWREEDCFKKLEGKSPYKKLMRLKQFIMDEFEFNLDLNTWGLTDKNIELKRFEKFISPKDIEASNALFGYHGDEYYFDVDIRKHFGLDKYDSDIIPYWKTETAEAMEAFRLKDGYRAGAGECVSLAMVYAAAAFVVCGIPLERIYMILTPLHSQNYIDIDDGVLTNNRRLITKTMWFNGTEISNRAQRALRNEQVTIVAHNTGYIHCFYNDATIDKNAYNNLRRKLSEYLNSGLTLLTLVNFLRHNAQYQKYLQFCRDCHRKSQFIKAETLFHYEHGSRFRIADSTHEKLLLEIGADDYVNTEMPDRFRCDQFKAFTEKNRIDLRKNNYRELLKGFLSPYVPDADELVSKLAEFLHTEAKLPGLEKNFVDTEPLQISTQMSRKKIIDYLKSIRTKNPVADLAFYAYRDVENCHWSPFIKVAIERSPVSIEITKEKTIQQCYQWLEQRPNKSIYDGKRIAHPDEVANYKTGDGIEKALTLANIILSREPRQKIEIFINGKDVLLKATEDYRFSSAKGLQKQLELP